MDSGAQLSRSYDLSSKVSRLYQKRVKVAQDRFKERVQEAYKEQVADLMAKPLAPWDIWTNLYRYSVDTAQRQATRRKRYGRPT